MPVMLHVVLAINTNNMCMLSIFMPVGNSNGLAYNIQSQQQCRNDSPLLYMFVILHESDAKLRKNNKQTKIK